MIYHSYWALVIGTLVTQATNVIVSYLVLPFRPQDHLPAYEGVLFLLRVAHGRPDRQHAQLAF